MSAPTMPKGSLLAMLDVSAMNRLSKPAKALVYMVVLTLATVGGIVALAVSVLLLGELSGVSMLSVV